MTLLRTSDEAVFTRNESSCSLGALSSSDQVDLCFGGVFGFDADGRDDGIDSVILECFGGGVNVDVVSHKVRQIW